MSEATRPTILDLTRRLFRRARIDLLRQPESLLLLVALLSLASLYVFIELADEVIEGETRAVDEAILMALREPGNRSDALGPVWLEEAARDLTALGSPAVLVIATFACAGYLLLRRSGRAVILLLISVGGGVGLVAALKAAFGRPRPDVVPHLTRVLTASFPSGHAAMSAIVYLTLAAVLARLAAEMRVRVYFVAVALGVAMIVGLTRVYAGVHYPSDVLAGWALGLSWATFVWLVTWAMERRRKV